MKTPEERALALFRILPDEDGPDPYRVCLASGGAPVPVWHGAREAAGAVMLRLVEAVIPAIREHEEDLLRFGARGCPLTPRQLSGLLGRIKECTGPTARAEVETVIRHLEAQVAFLAHENDYRQGYDGGRRGGWRACREAVLACLSRMCNRHASLVLVRLVETEVPEEG
jgi:hypothetical protein